MRLRTIAAQTVVFRAWTPLSRLLSAADYLRCRRSSSGTKMHIHLHAKASNVQPGKTGEGVEVFTHFCDRTGHNVERAWLIGDQVNPNLVSGSYDWSEI